jgi:hypothetical protein
MKEAIAYALRRAGMVTEPKSLLEPTLVRENLRLNDVVDVIAQAILEDLHQEVVSPSVKVWWS